MGAVNEIPQATTIDHNFFSSLDRIRARAISGMTLSKTHLFRSVQLVQAPKIISELIPTGMWHPCWSFPTNHEKILLYDEGREIAGQLVRRNRTKEKMLPQSVWCTPVLYSALCLSLFFHAVTTTAKFFGFSQNPLINSGGSPPPPPVAVKSKI